MKSKAIVWIIMFAVLFASPFPTYALLEKYLDSENYENREIAEKPVLTRDNFDTFEEEYELYFNDNIPYRNELVRLNSALELFCFRDSSSEKVLLGKDGWLFYTGPGNPVEQSAGYTGFTEEQLATLAARLKLARDCVEGNGAEFVFFIAPNKESIYLEELPDYYPVVSEVTQAKQLVEYLRENTDLRVVWPYEELLREKEESDCILYSYLDTHWGNTGAYVGARALARELGIEMPPLSSLSMEEEKISSGGLTRMLNVPIPDGDIEYQIEGYEVEDGNEGSPLMEFHHDKGDDRVLVMRRDSFGARLSKVLQHVFQDLYVSQSKDETDQYADIFVYEIVERNLKDIFVELDYAVCSSETEKGITTITLSTPGGVEYPYVSIFKCVEGSEDWEAVQVASPLQNVKIEVPEEESGRLLLYFLGDENGETVPYEDVFYY